MGENRVIGISTGCYYKLPLSFSEKVEKVKYTGAAGIELNLMVPEEAIGLRPSLAADAVEGFEYVSIHAPANDIYYDGGEESREVVEALEKLVEEMEDARNEPIPVIIHPDTVRGSLSSEPANYISFLKTWTDMESWVTPLFSS